MTRTWWNRHRGNGVCCSRPDDVADTRLDESTRPAAPHGRQFRHRGEPSATSGLYRRRSDPCRARRALAVHAPSSFRARPGASMSQDPHPGQRGSDRAYSPCESHRPRRPVPLPVAAHVTSSFRPASAPQLRALRIRLPGRVLESLVPVASTSVVKSSTSWNSRHVSGEPPSSAIRPQVSLRVRILH